MPRRILGQRAELHLPHRQPREAVVAHDADVQLAALDVFLDQRIGLHLVVHELDALLELRLVGDDRRLRNAERRVLGGRLHEQRVLDLARQPQLDAAPEHRELRRGNAVIRQQLFRQRLVTRQQQAARIAAGVRLAQQLEERDHVLVVGDDAVEFLEQVEDDLRLPLGDDAAQLLETVGDAEAAHLVTGFLERRDDVELGAPLFDVFCAVSFETVGRNQRGMHHDQRAQSLHSERRGLSPCAYRRVR